MIKHWVAIIGYFIYSMFTNDPSFKNLVIVTADRVKFCVASITSVPYLTLMSFILLASVARLDARPTADQEVAGSTPAEVGNILSWRLIMKYFLRSFSPFR